MKWYESLIDIKELEIGLIVIFIVFLPVIVVSVCMILVICPLCIHVFVSICSSTCILLNEGRKMTGREIGSLLLNIAINSFILVSFSFILVRGSMCILSWGLLRPYPL